MPKSLVFLLEKAAFLINSYVWGIRLVFPFCPSYNVLIKKHENSYGETKRGHFYGTAARGIQKTVKVHSALCHSMADSFQSAFMLAGYDFPEIPIAIVFAALCSHNRCLIFSGICLRQKALPCSGSGCGLSAISPLQSAFLPV